MPPDEPSDGLMPDDPFEGKNIPDFAEFTGPHAEEIRAFVREFANAKLDYSALLHQQSFRELRAAVWALDEERARAVLLRAVATSIAVNDHAGFSEWVEKQ